MNRDKDIGFHEREPRVLTELQIIEAQQETLLLLARKFAGTAIGPVFTQDDFIGSRTHSSSPSRSYIATRTANEYGDEIVFQAFMKASDLSKGNFMGDEIRIKRPSVLSHELVFEHVIHEWGGIRRTADPNTDVNRDSGLKVIRHLQKAR